MSTTVRGPWTAPRFAPGKPDVSELQPYRVTVGDDVYDQREFTASTSGRYYNFTSGVGAGKTVSGIMRAAANVEEWNAGEMGMIVTPTSLALKNVIMPELSKWGFLQQWEYKGPQSEEPGLHAPNGARILLESADNQRKIERLRGPSISWFWMDEAALIPEKAWDILVGRLRTGNYRNAFITTTPKGYNWVYDKFVDGGLDSVQNVLGVPSYANPHLPRDYRLEILDEYDDRFYEQEVLGKFTSFEGLVYRWFSEEDHVVAGDDLPAPEALDGVIYGVDWGFSNPAVALAIGRWGDQWIVLEEFYERRCTDGDHAEALQDMLNHWGQGPIYCDPAEPSSIEKFRREGLPADQAENEVTPGIKHVTGLQDDLRVASSCQNTINELGLYQYKEDSRDNPLKQHDHAMDALRYALFTHHESGFGGARSYYGPDIDGGSDGGSESPDRSGGGAGAASYYDPDNSNP